MMTACVPEVMPLRMDARHLHNEWLQQCYIDTQRLFSRGMDVSCAKLYFQQTLDMI